MRDLREFLDPARLPEWCELVNRLSPAEAEAALPALAALEKALSLRVSAIRIPAKVDTPAGGDRLLTAAQAGERLGVTPRWLRGRQLPFRVDVSPKCVRYSEAALGKWLLRKNRVA